MTFWQSHLDLLEAESIYILREATAQFSKPVLLYSIGKDSTVLLHLARKAFWPQNPPFPLSSPHYKQCSSRWRRLHSKAGRGEPFPPWRSFP